MLGKHPMSGRFAPSPTGDLHVGNLRTALLAWLMARASGRRFVVRMEDLDRVTSSPDIAGRQLADLAALGIDWDGPVEFQSTRFDRYQLAIERLAAQGLVYPCYCTRREIQAEVAAASSAPHTMPGAYPGTCRDLTPAERDERAASGRPAALRLRTDGATIEFSDVLAGSFAGPVDDVVLARADGVPAYNLAVVVDDAEQGIDQVVRGDDLLDSTPRQILLQRLLGYPQPDYAHVPLVVDNDGARLAKRHTAITLDDLSARGWSAGRVTAALARSLGIEVDGVVRAGELVDRFDPGRVPREPANVTRLLPNR